LLVGVVHHLLEEVRLDGVDHVEEVLSGWTFVLREDVGKVLRHIRIFCELRPEGPDGELIIMRHFNELYILLVEQLLLLGEYLLQKVFVDRLGRRQVVLNCKGMSLKMNGYLRCLSRYCMKSALDLSFQSSSEAYIKPNDLFLLDDIY